MKLTGNIASILIRFGLLGSALLIGHTTWAETSEFTDVVSLIKNQKYDEAELQVDAVLKTEPKNVNALMYKGNILYYRGSNTGSIQLHGNADESIYDSSIGYIGEGSSLISPDVARDVAVYFKRALSQAPERMDIQMGLCWVYANAGLKDELAARFPELKRHSGNRPGLQYNMGDYARIIVDNYQYDDGIAVYQVITKLYPDDGNIVNDIAAMYFKKGDLDTALKYFSQAARMSSRDEKTIGNLALIYAISGDYTKSLQYQKQASTLNKDHTDVLYRALYKRLSKDPGWVGDVKVFLKKNQGNEEYKDYSMFAETLLPVEGKYIFQQYEISKGHKVTSHFDIINYEWAAREYPDQYGALFDLAELLTYYRNYRKAVPIYERIQEKSLAKTIEEREKLNFYYAWVLYSTGRIDEANSRWKQLLESEDFYRKSAASYFLGNYHYQRKERKQAGEYFKLVKDQASKSKYANFSNNLYKQIEGEKGGKTGTDLINLLHMD